jgi:ADP-glucose pyrophosphorylase
MAGACVGVGATVRNAIAGEGVDVPAGSRLIGGLARPDDGHTVSARGVVVVEAGDKVA